MTHQEFQTYLLQLFQAQPDQALDRLRTDPVTHGFVQTMSYWLEQAQRQEPLFGPAVRRWRLEFQPAQPDRTELVHFVREHLIEPESGRWQPVPGSFSLLAPAQLDTRSAGLDRGPSPVAPDSNGPDTHTGGTG
jgi:hypothetical protein